MNNKLLSASLLKRLAEAADGFRDGREIWCVAATKFPHELEVFFSEVEADALCKVRTKTHSVFGPFKTGSETARLAVRPEIIEISVTIKEGGKTKQVKVDPKEVDCLFWSESAVDKFVIPYYARLYGVEHAAKMRKTFAAERKALSGHDRKTRWLEI